LAGTVATDEADHLAGVEVDRDVLHRMHAAERHVDVAHLDEDRAVSGTARGSVAATLGISACPGLGIRRLAGHRALRRRTSVSKPMALTSTTPTTMSWIGESTRSRSMPERSDCMTTAPRTAPGIVPMPPENDVPPITAAAIVSSSAWTPRLVTADWSRADWIAPLTAASTPISMNVYKIVRLTLMPPSSAASGLPPIANT